MSEFATAMVPCYQCFDTYEGARHWRAERESGMSSRMTHVPIGRQRHMPGSAKVNTVASTRQSRHWGWYFVVLVKMHQKGGGGRLVKTPKYYRGGGQP